MRKTFFKFNGRTAIMECVSAKKVRELCASVKDDELFLAALAVLLKRAGGEALNLGKECESEFAKILLKKGVSVDGVKALGVKVSETTIKRKKEQIRAERRK